MNKRFGFEDAEVSFHVGFSSLRQQQASCEYCLESGNKLSKIVIVSRGGGGVIVTMFLVSFNA